MTHSFDVGIAEKYGVHAAVLLQNLYYWINKNKANEKHFHDGYYWTYNSVKAYMAMFPYMGKKQISYALDKLEDDGVIITGNYNEASYDRTKWYAITKKGYELFGVSDPVSMEPTLQKGETDFPKGETDFPKGETDFPKGETDFPKGEMAFPKREQPIPDNKPDNKPNNNISISPNGNIDIVGDAPTQPQDPDASEPEEPKRENLKYNSIEGMFNTICKDLPQVRAMPDARKRAVRMLLNELESLEVMSGLSPYEKLRELFQAVQESDFLTGRSGKWGKCSFDWIVNKKNALKILEGNYENERGGGNARADTGARNNGESGNADNRPFEGTTISALERFRRNAGAAEDL